MGAYEDRSPGAAAAKWLHPDGSVTDAEGNPLSPASGAGAADYESRSPRAAKWLLPDGTVTDTLPGAGSDGTGNGEGEGGGSGPAIEIEVPIVSTDSLGEVFLTGHITAPEWGDDITGFTSAYTDAAAASVT